VVPAAAIVFEVAATDVALALVPLPTPLNRALPNPDDQLLQVSVEPEVASAAKPKRIAIVLGETVVSAVTEGKAVARPDEALMPEATATSKGVEISTPE